MWYKTLYTLREVISDNYKGSTKLQTDNTIPSDIAIPPYRGSTIKEKIDIVEKFSERKMLSVVLQDGTNRF